MGLRFHRRLSLILGIRVNLSGSGASLSIGHRGAWYTIGLPGSGLYGTESVPPDAAPHAGHQAAFVIMVLIGLAVLFWATWPKTG